MISREEKGSSLKDTVTNRGQLRFFVALEPIGRLFKPHFTTDT